MFLLILLQITALDNNLAMIKKPLDGPTVDISDGYKTPKAIRMDILTASITD